MNQQLLNQYNGNIIEDDIVNESNIKNISQLIKHIECSKKKREKKDWKGNFETI